MLPNGPVCNSRIRISWWYLRIEMLTNLPLNLEDQTALRSGAMEIGYLVPQPAGLIYTQHRCEGFYDPAQGRDRLHRSPSPDYRSRSLNSHSR